jgi:hypothetical protein
MTGYRQQLVDIVGLVIEALFMHEHQPVECLGDATALAAVSPRLYKL